MIYNNNNNNNPKTGPFGRGFLDVGLDSLTAEYRLELRGAPPPDPIQCQRSITAWVE